MTQEEQIRLYRLMEKLNWFFHQEMHYLDREICAEKTARECYPEIRDFTYDILWNDLPKEVQEQLHGRGGIPMSTLICSFDGLHDNRVLRYCADFEAHTLHMDTRTEAGEKVSVRFTGLLAHWFENVIQDNILFGMDEITVDGFFRAVRRPAGRDHPLRLSRPSPHRGTAGAHGSGAHPGVCHRLFPWAVRLCTGSGGGNSMTQPGAEGSQGIKRDDFKKHKSNCQRAWLQSSFRLCL